MGKRTKAIQRKLKGVDNIGVAESMALLSESDEAENADNDDDA
jgi:hypothetical protein